MKGRQIFLVQAANEVALYFVDRLVNCIEPEVGTRLDKREVSLLLAKHNTTVTIRRFMS